MKNYKFLMLTLVLLALISLSAVSAQEISDDIGAADDSDAVSVDSDAGKLTSNNYDKSIYVDTQGNDSGSGSEGSPYASINKAISEVNASDNAAIYLNAGIYTGENNIDLSINLAHKNYNGSLTFIGAGKDKTIIDANKEGQIFKSISADSIVIFKNIGFINAKAPNYGSAIVSDGDLTIDNCLFVNNTANSYATVYQDEPNNFKVINSVFRDNTAGSGNVNIYYSTYQDSDCVVEIINNTFSNATTDYGWADSSCVYVQASHILVQGNTFVNIRGTGKGSLNVRADDCNVTDNVFKDCSYDGTNDGGILYIGDAYIQGNTFENWTSTKGAPIYALLNFNAYLAYDDKLVEEATFKLTCNITDDMGNPVNTYGEVFFYLNGENLGRTKANNGVATLTVNKLLENGVYDLTGTYSYVSFGEADNPFECTVKNGTVTVDFDHNYMDVWVAADGNDTTGNGSENNPFQTIKNAIDYAIDEDSVEFTIHLKDGLYNITGDYGLSYSDVVKFSIVGENYGKAIISGNNAGITLLTSGVYTDVSLKNLTFINSSATRAFNVRYLTMEDCIVNNVGQLYAQTNPSRVVLRNVTWSNTRNLMMYNAEIYDSLFENITTSGTGVLWLATCTNNDMVIIMNSKFINIENTGSNGAVAYVQGDFVSINNTYALNKASNGDYGVLYVSANYAVSINDTFIDNEAAENYGAAFFVGRTQDSVITIANAKFINNTAGENGGALGTNGAVLVNCTFEDNTAGLNGGAIYTLTHTSSYSYFDNLTLTDVTFKDNAADGNGQDIFITPPASSSSFSANLAGMTVSFNDLSTKTLQDFVSANVTHTSGAIIGGGKITFYLNGSYMGVAEVIDGVATLDYLGFKKNGTFVLSGEYNLATDDTVYNNATVVVALAPLKDNVTLYVSDSKGNDTTGDGSLTNPYKTINTALTNGYKQSAVITVRVLEGVYSGELNNNLTVASSLDISIVGDGQDKTIIDGQDVSWFLNILAGDSLVKIANMTVANVTKNYVDAKLYNQKSAISIEKGATVMIDNVGFIRCHGTEGGAIYTEGTLGVVNSYFFNNGDSNYGAAIKNYGTLMVFDTEFVANHAKYYSTIYNEGNFLLYNSVIQDAMRVNGFTGNAMVMGGPGNITIYNSTIFRSGKTCDELIGPGQTWANNPGFAISIGSTGNVKVVDSVIDGNNKAYSAQYITNVAFGGSGSIGVFVPYGLEVVNTKILNLKDIISNSKGTNLIDGCYIENVTYVSEGTSYDYNITVVNSYFADGTTMATKRATANVILDNNWWGTNDQPTYKVGTVNTNPDTWLILTLDSTDDPGLLQDVVLAFKVTDGEDITDYDDDLYVRDFTISAVNGTLTAENGTISNEVLMEFKGINNSPYYIEATVDGQTVNITKDAVKLGKATIEDPDVFLYVDEDQFDVFVDVDGREDVGKFNITLTVNGTDYEVEVIDGVASFTIDQLPYGEYKINYTIAENDVCEPTVIPAYLIVVRYAPFIDVVSNVTDEIVIILSGIDDEPLANASLSYSIDGVETTGVTDENGQIIVSGLKGTVEVIVNYAGDDFYGPCNFEDNVTVYNGRKATKISIVYVDGKLNVGGVLTDEDDNPLANETIVYTFGNLSNTTVTDEYGYFTVAADNGKLTFVYPENYDFLESYAVIVLKDIAPLKEVPEISADCPVVATVGDNINITVRVANATGSIGLYFDDNFIDAGVLDENSTLTFSVSDLIAGDHYFTVVYSGDDKFEKGFMNLAISVAKKASEANITVPSDVKAGERANIEVAIPNATGEVTVFVDGDKYEIPLDNGTASVLIPAAEAGDHSVVVVYSGDETHDATVASATFSVEKVQTEANITTPVDFKVGEEANVTVDIPGASGNVSVIVNGIENVVPLDENGSAVATFNVTDGENSIVVVYSGDETHSPVVKTATFFAVVVTTKFDNVTVESDLNITAILIDGMGDGIANATITYTIGNVTNSTITGTSGEFTIPGVAGETITIDYAGDDVKLPTTLTLTLSDVVPELVESHFNITGGVITLNGYAVDTKAGEHGMTYATELLDSNGKPISGVKIQFAVNDKIYNRTTDEKGGFTPYHLDMVRAERYTMAFFFSGNENYTSAFGSVCVDLDKKPMYISASAKSYKASTKTKSYTVTLYTEPCSSADGKAHLSSGKKVTLTVNGKTYTGKTNAKGQVTFKITNLSKKGVYAAKIGYAGDLTYESATKSVKLTIK